MSIMPGPGDRILEPVQPGQLISRAGDRLRRANNAAAKRAREAQKAADPARLAAREAAELRARRNRVVGRLNAALSRLDDARSQEVSLHADLDRARLRALHVSDAEEKVSALAHSARYERLLGQLPAVIALAERDVQAARDAVRAFDSAEAARAADDKVRQEDAAARAELERRALDAAEKAYNAFLREHDHG